MNRWTKISRRWNRQIYESRAAVKKARRVRSDVDYLREFLGYFKVEDAAQVHLRGVKTFSLPYYWRWRIYIPPEDKLELRFLHGPEVRSNGQRSWNASSPHESKPFPASGEMLLDVRLYQNPHKPRLQQWTLAADVLSPDGAEVKHTMRFAAPPSVASWLNASRDQQITQNGGRRLYQARKKYRNLSLLFFSPKDVTDPAGKPLPGIALWLKKTQ